MHDPRYDFLLNTRTGAKWQTLGTVRRAGVAVPLFSVYSKNSIGIGEIPDIALLADWCRESGMSLLQLLPLNDAGFRFTPYDAESSFALDPVYLSLENLAEIKKPAIARKLAQLRKDFPLNTLKVNYGIKGRKLALLYEIFDKDADIQSAGFERFKREQAFWLSDYALFKAAKSIYENRSWEDWADPIRTRQSAALEAFAQEQARAILFQEWLQYQLFLQFTEAHRKMREKGVWLMGDLPFLVSRDSADVWAHPEYFKLELESGAPPDLYFAMGQRWGMPPYRWDEIAARGYDYVIQKLRYAENFYDLYRIDHVVGIFRVWTVPVSEPPEYHGSRGVFDPADEALWEGQGRRLLELMIDSTSMMPCAEDLGVVPDCAVRVLKEFGIPGMDVQRWTRDWGRSYDFKAPETYRPASIALVTTHDMVSFKVWWEQEAGTVDAERFRKACVEAQLDFDQLRGRLFDTGPSAARLRWRRDVSDTGRLLEILQLPQEKAWAFLDFYRAAFPEKEQFWNFLHPSPAKGQPYPEASSPELVRTVLEKINAAQSVFSVQFFSDLLCLHPEYHAMAEAFKVNQPGTFGDHNWTARMPCALEDLRALKPLKTALKNLHAAAGRI